MTRAEATARVVAAAKRVSGELEAARALWPSRNEAERAESLRRLLNEDLHLHDSIKALDACPPKDEDAVVAMWYDLRDAWALAWAGWQEAYDWREHNGYGPKWNFGSHEGWPTRDAEHAAWAGRYRARGYMVLPGRPGGLDVSSSRSGPEVEAGGEVDHGPTCFQCNQRKRKELSELHRLMLEQIPLPTGALVVPTEGPDAPQAGPAPAQSDAPVPELGKMLADIDAMTKLAAETIQARDNISARLDALAAQVGVIDERLSVEEANALNDGIADRMRLTALEAQVGRVERAVRAMATRTARDMLDGGPDA